MRFRSSPTRVLAWIAFVFAPGIPAAALDLLPTRPNILLILADDLGYSDIGAFGGEIRTPNLDRLAADGLVFTRFTNASKCEPSRTALATGRSDGWIGPSAGKVNLVRELNAAGYRTYMTGKTHGFPAEGTRRSAVMSRPQGDYWNLSTVNPDGRRSPGALLVDGQPVADLSAQHPDFYSTDVFTDYAIQFLRADRDASAPFFLYVAYNAPHYPLHAPPEDIARYRGKYRDVGWDRLRVQRHARLIELGILPAGTPLSPRDPDVRAWDELTDAEKDDQDLRMATYAAMVDRMDQNIGRLLAALDELGQRDNTVVLFLSDNGGCPVLHKEIGRPGPANSFTYVGEGWAHASNTPWRGFKTQPVLGGVSTPLLVRWPAVVKPGGRDREFAHIVDLTATALDLAGRPNRDILGLTLAPAFRGEQRPLHAEFNWGWWRHRAALRGDWKLVSLGESAPVGPLKRQARLQGGEVGRTPHGDGPWQLFNLANDPLELRDVAAEHPDIVADLRRQWEAWDVHYTYELEPAHGASGAGKAQ